MGKERKEKGKFRHPNPPKERPPTPFRFQFGATKRIFPSTLALSK